MTETPGVGFRLWFEGVENKFRNDARALVHRLRTFALSRWQASANSKLAAGDWLGAAFWRQSRADKGDAATPPLVREAIAADSFRYAMFIR
jgi:hypothetical protein